MNRLKFIKSVFTTGLFSTFIPAHLSGENKHTKQLKLKEQIGYNHLPNKEEIEMNTVIHKEHTRGHANHGWLDTHHTFSFANYHNPERMHFGALRVLNDDIINPEMGFGSHPHDNMEIISIPLQGSLEHKDSMGNVHVIKKGDIQIMSAGTGIYHSEYNREKDQQTRFLQIWVFPNKQNVEPRYDQITLVEHDRKNRFQQIVSPNKNDAGVWIQQDAWFHIADLDSAKNITYQFKGKNTGVYIFVLSGKIKVDEHELNIRDGIGTWDISEINIEALSNAELLLMEVPINI